MLWVLGFPGVSLESGKRSLLICLFSCLPYLIGGLSPIVGIQGADKYLWSFCSYLFVMGNSREPAKVSRCFLGPWRVWSSTCLCAAELGLHLVAKILYLLTISRQYF